MNFRVDCPCGKHVEVSEGSAGAVVECSCGRPVKVPCLAELRRMSGLATQQAHPVLLLRGLLAAGKLPPGRACAGCGADTDGNVEVSVECEKAHVREVGGTPLWAVLLAGLLFPPLLLVWAILRSRPQLEEYGEDVSLTLPL